MEAKQEKQTLRTIQGTVVSTKMQKTVTIEIRQKYIHPRTGKVIQKTKKLKVHDEKGQAGMGDTILAFETRHLSKDKYHSLLKVVEKAK